MGKREKGMSCLAEEGLGEGLLMNLQRSTRKTVHIEKVRNGFIVSAASNGFDEKKAIAKTKKEANKMASRFFNK